MANSSKWSELTEVPANRRNIAARFLELGFGKNTPDGQTIMERFFELDVVLIVRDATPGSPQPDKVWTFKQGSPWSKVCNKLAAPKSKSPDGKK